MSYVYIMMPPAISINLSFQQLLDAVKKLQPPEKILPNEVLWDETVLIPSEH